MSMSNMVQLRASCRVGFEKFFKSGSECVNVRISLPPLHKIMVNLGWVVVLVQPLAQLTNRSACVGVTGGVVKGNHLVVVTPPKVGLVQSLVGSHLRNVLGQCWKGLEIESIDVGVGRNVQ